MCGEFEVCSCREKIEALEKELEERSRTFPVVIRALSEDLIREREKTAKAEESLRLFSARTEYAAPPPPVVPSPPTFSTFAERSAARNASTTSSSTSSTSSTSTDLFSGSFSMIKSAAEPNLNEMAARYERAALTFLAASQQLLGVKEGHSSQIPDPYYVQFCRNGGSDGFFECAPKKHNPDIRERYVFTVFNVVIVYSNSPGGSRKFEVIKVIPFSPAGEAFPNSIKAVDLSEFTFRNPSVDAQIASGRGYSLQWTFTLQSPEVITVIRPKTGSYDNDFKFSLNWKEGNVLFLD